MRLPRSRIAWLMIIVAFTAINFGAIRVWSQLRLDRNMVDNRVEALTYGTLPMANLLAIGILVGLRRPEIRPFLWGFVAFGATALALFVPLAYLYTEEVVQPYILWVLRLKSLKSLARNLSPEARIPMNYSVATLLVGLPQLAFALIGGFLFKDRLAGKPEV